MRSTLQRLSFRKRPTGLTFIIVAILASMIPTFAQSQPKPALVPAHSSELSLFTYSYFYEDASSTLTAELVRDLPVSNMLHASQLDRSGWGFTNSSVWVKIPLILQGDTATRRVLIGSDRPDMALVAISIFADQELLAYQVSGATIPPEQRPVPGRLPLGTFELPTNRPLLAIVKMQTRLFLNLPIRIYSSEGAQNRFNLVNYTFAIYFSFLAGLIGYNFILFCLLRYREYLLYCFFGLSMMLNSLGQAGFFEFMPWLPFFNSVHDSIYLLCLPPITAMLFTRSFLKLNIIAPKLDQFIKIAIYLSLALALLIAAPSGEVFLPSVNLVNAVCFVSVLSAGVIASLKRDAAAYTFTSAWGILTFAAIVWTLANNGLLQKTYLLAFAPLFGNMIEMLLMAIALAIRIKQLERKERLAEIKTRESEQLKRLLRVLCHDINNPLAVITGTTWIAKRRINEPQTMNRLWVRIERASESISDIIEQVRNYEAIRSGKLKPKIESVSVRQLFENAEFIFQDRAKQKGVRLSFSLDDCKANETHWVRGEATALGHEVINNLISNAIKFTNPGGVITVTSQQLGPSDIQIKICDNGIGIPPNILEKIFDPNANTSRPGTNSEKGTGFGLPLAKSYIENFGGSISISSKVKTEPADESGTCFTIILKASDAQTEPSPKNPKIKSLH